MTGLELAKRLKSYGYEQIEGKELLCFEPMTCANLYRLFPRFEPETKLFRIETAEIITGDEGSIVVEGVNLKVLLTATEAAIAIWEGGLRRKADPTKAKELTALQDKLAIYGYRREPGNDEYDSSFSPFTDGDRYVFYAQFSPYTFIFKIEVLERATNFVFMRLEGTSLRTLLQSMEVALITWKFVL